MRPLPAKGGGFSFSAPSLRAHSTLGLGFASTAVFPAMFVAHALLYKVYRSDACHHSAFT